MRQRHGGSDKDDSGNPKAKLCKVAGCTVDLASLGKPYCLRKRVCPEHMKAGMVRQKGCGGEPFRFCQQCGNLEPLHCFEGTNRSCKSRLDKRRWLKQQQQQSSTAAKDSSSNRSSSQAVINPHSSQSNAQHAHNAPLSSLLGVYEWATLGRAAAAAAPDQDLAAAAAAAAGTLDSCTTAAATAAAASGRNRNGMHRMLSYDGSKCSIDTTLPSPRFVAVLQHRASTAAAACATDTLDKCNAGTAAAFDASDNSIAAAAAAEKPWKSESVVTHDELVTNVAGVVAAAAAGPSAAAAEVESAMIDEQIWLQVQHAISNSSTKRPALSQQQQRQCSSAIRRQISSNITHKDLVLHDVMGKDLEMLIEQVLLAAAESAVVDVKPAEPQMQQTTLGFNNITKNSNPHTSQSGKGLAQPAPLGFCNDLAQLVKPQTQLARPAGCNTSSSSAAAVGHQQQQWQQQQQQQAPQCSPSLPTAVVPAAAAAAEAAVSAAAAAGMASEQFDMLLLQVTQMQTMLLQMRSQMQR